MRLRASVHASIQPARRSAQPHRWPDNGSWRLSSAQGQVQTRTQHNMPKTKWSALAFDPPPPPLWHSAEALRDSAGTLQRP